MMVQQENSENEKTNKESSNEKVVHPEPPSVSEIYPSPSVYFKSYCMLSALIGAIAVSTVLFIAAEECRQCFNQPEKPPIVLSQDDRKIFWAYGKNVNSGYLNEVFTVLNRLGYKNDPNSTNWDLLWAHDYPFQKLYPKFNNLKSHQKVNHFPGCGYITNKVNLATSGLPYIPPAFKLPGDKDKLLEYASKNPNLTFVQKNNDHREIRIQDITKVDLDAEGTFLQEYVDKPFLVNGHKFDIGIYTVITSIDPLRVYIYNGEALLRFCPEKYYPFDPKNLDKYVIGDDYLPIWEVPSLDYYYNELGFGMRDSLNAFLESKGKDPSIIWEQIEDAIRTVMLSKEAVILDIVKKFRSKRNFFEMMRFDFVIDENLKIYLLEANMSPNLSSAHFPPNRLLYQQVLYNVLGLVGVGEQIHRNSLAARSKAEEEMIVSDKNLAVFQKTCNSNLCRSSCVSPECHLCKPCLSPDTRQYLVQAYREHLHRGDCKRIFPLTMDREEAIKGINVESFSPENQLQYQWFQGKCILESSWC